MVLLALHVRGLKCLRWRAALLRASGLSETVVRKFGQEEIACETLTLLDEDILFRGLECLDDRFGDFG